MNVLEFTSNYQLCFSLYLECLNALIDWMIDWSTSPWKTSEYPDRNVGKDKPAFSHAGIREPPPFAINHLITNDTYMWQSKLESEHKTDFSKSSFRHILT